MNEMYKKVDIFNAKKTVIYVSFGFCVVWLGGLNQSYSLFSLSVGGRNWDTDVEAL